MPRYLFILPDVNKPTGGMNVALQFIDVLNKAGYEAVPVFSGPKSEYRYSGLILHPLFLPALTKVRRSFLRRRDRFLDSLNILGAAKSVLSPNKLDLRRDDVVVLPEFLYPEYSRMFPNQRKVVLVQDVFGFLRARHRSLTAGESSLDDFIGICATSKATSEAVTKFTGKTADLIPLSINLNSLVSSEAKKRQIAYMPRKRSEEVQIVVEHLRMNPIFDDWKFVEIANVGLKDAHNILRDSLFFLSFSEREGFGLPPAEAMAAGCIVIGYTGVGGEEFFKPEFSFPIPDSDVSALVGTVEELILEYEKDPRRLDKLRQDASKFISENYSDEAMTSSLLRIWARFDRSQI